MTDRLEEKVGRLSTPAPIETATFLLLFGALIIQLTHYIVYSLGRWLEIITLHVGATILLAIGLLCITTLKTRLIMVVNK